MVFRQTAQVLFILGLGALTVSSHNLVATALGNVGFILTNHTLAHGDMIGQSEIWLRQAITWTDNEHHLQSGLALIYHDQGQQQQALATWREAKIDPNYLLIWSQRSWAEKNYEDALVWLQYAKDIAPGWAKSYFWLGKIYNIEQRPDAAINELRQAKKLLPSNRDIWYELAQSYQSKQMYSAALEALISAQKAAEGYSIIGASNILFEIGYIQQNFIKSPDTAAAWNAYEQALNTNDFTAKPWQKANTYYQRGLLLAAEEQWEAARIEYQRALALNPDAYFLRLSYARTLQQLGKQQLAVNVLRQAIDLRPDGVEAIILLGDVYFWENDLDTAQRLYAQAARLAPGNVEVSTRLKAIEEARVQ